MKTFTKKIISIILIISLIDLQFPFILAFLGREQIAEDLGKILVTELIGIFFVYCTKSFFETREEKLLDFKKSGGLNDNGIYDTGQTSRDDLDCSNDICNQLDDSIRN